MPTRTNSLPPLPIARCQQITDSYEASPIALHRGDLRRAEEAAAGAGRELAAEAARRQAR